MRSRIVAASTASPGRTNAHSRLRANSTTGPLLPAVANACGCSMLAEANTSACAPPKISSFSVPEGPYLACTLCPDAASNAAATSVAYHHVASYGFTPEQKEYMKEHALRPDRGSVTGRVVLQGKSVHVVDTKADA